MAKLPKDVPTAPGQRVELRGRGKRGTVAWVNAENGPSLLSQSVPICGIAELAQIDIEEHKS